jgi:hypothetical protein
MLLLLLLVLLFMLSHVCELIATDLSKALNVVLVVAFEQDNYAACVPTHEVLHYNYQKLVTTH